MPTIFGRKYMRGRPGPVEKMVGAFVLGLTAFILGSFLLTGGLLEEAVEGSSVLSGIRNLYGISKEPLFVAREENLQPPAPPHEIRTAQAMLPVAGDALKRAEVAALAVRPGEEHTLPGVESERLSSLWEAASAYDARWMYTARYEVPEAEGMTTPVGEVARVFTFDMGDPACAFGIWRARRPSGGERASLGRDGWRGTLAEEGIRVWTFWSGRYYTEVWRTGLPGQEVIETPSGESMHVGNTLSATAARLQLTYGGPFWADRVLPGEDRVADSFRYVRKNALGLDELSECWLADYAGEVTLAVMQPRGMQRDKLLSALRERVRTGGVDGGGEDGLAGESAAYGGAEQSYGEESYEEAASAYDGAEGGDTAEGYGAEGQDEYGGGYGAAAESATEGADGASTLRSWAASVETEAVVGRMGDRLIAAYTTPDYVFVVTGEDPSRMTALAEATYERWGAPRFESGQLMARAGEEGQAGQARFAEVPGGRILAPTSTERYADNVYEKINGKEGAFRAFHFRELRFGRYAVAGSQDAYDVYIYDMAEPVNAFGMYMSERSYTAEPVELGRAGYVSGSSAFFWKSKYYVNVLGPPEDSPDKTETAVQIARAIEETIADDGEPFWAQEVLPEAERVPDSLAYQATSALTFEFLEGIFIATYENEAGVEYQMFVGRYASPEEADGIFSRYAEAVAEYDTVVSEESGEGFRQIVTESAGFYTSAFVSGEYFAGVTETDDPDVAVGRSGMFRRQLMERDSGS